MGQGGGKSSTGTVWQRLVIAMFGLGIVVIGIQPIQKKYGNFGRFVKIHTTALAREPLQSFKGAKVNSPAVRTMDVPSGKIVRSTDGVNAKASNNAKKVDNLKESDRKELNKLLDNL